MSSSLSIVVLLMTAMSHSLGESQSPCNGEKVPEVYRLTSVTKCPTGKDREQTAKSCNNSNNVFHCLPDKNGDLFTFCGKRKSHLRYSYFVVDNNETLHLNSLGFTIFPGTDTEIYSNLSQVVINAPVSLDSFPIFEKLQEELDLTATNACRDNLIGYVLPSRDACNFINTCSRPRYVSCINIYIVNVSNGNGSIIEREFPVPKTNEKKYALLALVFCRIYRSTLMKQCLKLPVTQDHISSTIQTRMHSDETLSTDTTSQPPCRENETQICQECNNTGLIIIIVLLIIAIIGMGLEMKFHFIKKKWLKRNQQSSEMQKGQYAQPTDTFDTSHQSNVEPSQN